MNKNLLQIHAKSFYWASFFLSKKIFYQCSVLYNFCRTLDDIVDSEKQLEIRKKEFSNFKNDFFTKRLQNGPLDLSRPPSGAKFRYLADDRRQENQNQERKIKAGRFGTEKDYK